MITTADYLQLYLRDDYVLFPHYFSTAEVAALAAEFAEEGPRRVVEKDGKTVRSVYGAHTTNEVFRRLACHPRLVGPARCMLGSEVYVY